MAADTPESLVYLGREGTGAAQIFGREGNPFRALQMRRLQDDQRKAVEAATRQKAKQERDKRMFEMIDVDPEKTFQPFNQQVLEAAAGHRSNIVDAIRKGQDPNDVNFLLGVKQGWNQVNDIARRGEYIKDKLTQTRDLIKTDPYLDAKYYNDKLNDLYMDEFGNGKPIDQVDVNAIDQVFMNDVGGFNRKKYASDFMKDIKSNVLNFIEQRQIAEGLETRDIKLKVPELIYTPDENEPSGIKRNPDGTPVINVTPDFKQAFLQNGIAKKAFEQDAEASGMSVDDVIKSWIESEGPKPEKDVSVQISRNPEWYYDELDLARTGISRKELPLYTRRYQNINNAINAFVDPDGTRRTDASPEAKAALGHLKKNMKVAGGDVLDAVFVAGNNTPGIGQVLDMPVENSPNDRVIFKVKSGTRGLPQPIEINLADEGAGAELNALFEQAKTEGKTSISFDKLLELNQVKPQDVYKGRAGLTEQNEKAKEMENQTISNWQKGEGLDLLKGRQYGGRRIVSARRVKTETGYFGFGGKYGIELSVDSGDRVNPIKYEIIPEEDYEQLARVYRGENAGGQVGESGVKWKK